MEYAKYVPTEQLDIAGLTSKFAEKISGIGEERKKKKEELDLMADEAIDLVSNPDMTTSQTANDLILKKAQASRNQVNEWNKSLKNGKLKPDEYKRRINNLSKQTDDLAKSFKTFDQRYVELTKRQADRTASVTELDASSKWGSVADISNAELITDENGNIFYKNKKTGEQLSLSALNRPENSIINRVDVNAESARISETWKKDGRFKDLGKGGSETIESFWKNPSSENALDMGTMSIISNPKSALSVYADYLNVPVVLYSTDAEKEQEKARLVKEAEERSTRTNIPVSQKDLDDIEMRLVRMGVDGQQVKQPVLTKAQQDKVYEAVKETLRSQIETDITGESKQDWSKPASTGDGGGGTGKKEDITNLYEDLRTAWDLSKKGDRSSVRESESRLNAYAEGKFEFEWKKGGLQVSKVVVDEQTGRKSLVPIKGTLSSLDAAQKYFYPEKNQYDFEKEEYLGKKQRVSEKVEEKMVTFVLPDGQVGNIPEGKISEFLKKNPKAKRK